MFNAVGPLASEYGADKRAVDLTIDEFVVPLLTIVRSQFITASGAARRMVQQRPSDSILRPANFAAGIGRAFSELTTYQARAVLPYE